LRNAVYSEKKALELKQTLDTVGFNWFNMKEQIRAMKAASGPPVVS
jgi:hypothetical protein